MLADATERLSDRETTVKFDVRQLARMIDLIAVRADVDLAEVLPTERAEHRDEEQEAV